jgi:hypothetical protein
VPLLADALEDAGCTDADLLGHLRSPGPHVRRWIWCWGRVEDSLRAQAPSGIAGFLESYSGHVETDTCVQ